MDNFFYIPEGPLGLTIANIILHIVHSGLVLFILFGAFYRPWVKAHFITIMVVWLSWIALGIFTGTLGYCPLTDWHWQVKLHMGEVVTQPSYIEYIYTHATGKDVNNRTMSGIIAGVVMVATLISAGRMVFGKKYV